MSFDLEWHNFLQISKYLLSCLALYYVVKNVVMIRREQMQELPRQTMVDLMKKNLSSAVLAAVSSLVIALTAYLYQDQILQDFQKQSQEQQAQLQSYENSQRQLSENLREARILIKEKQQSIDNTQYMLFNLISELGKGNNPITMIERGSETDDERSFTSYNHNAEQINPLVRRNYSIYVTKDMKEDFHSMVGQYKKLAMEKRLGNDLVQAPLEEDETAISALQFRFYPLKDKEENTQTCVNIYHKGKVVFKETFGQGEEWSVASPQNYTVRLNEPITLGDIEHLTIQGYFENSSQNAEKDWNVLFSIIATGDKVAIPLLPSIFYEMDQGELASGNTKREWRLGNIR